MLRASFLMLEVNEFRCYEAKIEVGGHQAVAQARGVMDSTPGLFTSLYFRHITSKFIVRQDTLSTKHLYRVQQLT